MGKLVLLLTAAAVIGVVASTRYGSGAYYQPGSRGYFGGTGSYVGYYDWNSWGYWGTCSKECGGGYQTRTRTCNKPAYAYRDCVGASSETRSCNTAYCKVNGGWSAWGSYGGCSKKCGVGYKTKYRTCTNPAPSYGGNDCYGSNSYTESCTGYDCKVHGGWSEWGHYGGCSKTCGVGYKTKYRTCTNPAPSYGGNNCQGYSSYTASCTVKDYCPVHGGWSAWGSYGGCSKECGVGYKTKYRTCTNPAPSYGGNDCYGSSSHTETCTGYNCKVHGGWSEWGHYSECSKSCGTGYKTKYRTCTNPAPSNGGNNCYGENTYTMSCTGSSTYCPVHGGWSEWGHYGGCSKDCGVGYKTKYRTCTNPAPSYGGNDCYGSNSYTETCTGYDCKVDGGWSQWGHYGDCSKTCGVGYKTRHRTCSNPAPSNGGAYCYGSSIYTATCTGYDCKVHGGWSAWGTYGGCSKSCGVGYKTRYRTCTNPAPAYGGNDCNGYSSYTATCTGYHCKVDGGWSNWGYYSACSKSCGTGYRTKRRTCTNPAPSYGGAACYGQSSYTETCHGTSNHCGGYVGY